MLISFKKGEALANLVIRKFNKDNGLYERLKDYFIKEAVKATAEYSYYVIVKRSSSSYDYWVKLSPVVKHTSKHSSYKEAFEEASHQWFSDEQCGYPLKHNNPFEPCYSGRVEIVRSDGVVMKVFS